MEKKKNEVSSQSNLLRNSIVILLVIFVAIGLFLGVLGKNQPRNPEITTKAQVSNTPVPVNHPVVPGGSFNISIKENTRKFNVGRLLPVTVKGNSEGKEIAGFDVLITYDPSVLLVSKVLPRESQFQISSFTKKKGQISITGTKVSASKTPTMLNDEDIVVVNFVTLKESSTTIELKQEIKNEKTRMIDSKYYEFKPNLNSVSVKIL